MARTADGAAKAFEGGCQCAAVRYRVTGEPLTLFACHCKECQRQSSSAFGMALWVRLGALELLRGSLEEWVRLTPAGQRMLCRFCGKCGTRIFHQPEGQQEVVSIKPGTLDDVSGLAPVAHLWTSRAQPWMTPALAGLCYTGNPEPGFGPLMHAWAARHGQGNPTDEAT